MIKRSKTDYHNFWVLIACLIIAFLPGVIGSVITSGTLNSSWYESVKPSIAPPNWVFSIIWVILYFLIGISLYYLWTAKGDNNHKLKICVFFGTNLLFNALWSIAYFSLRDVYLAFIIMLFILISLLGVMIISFRRSKISGYLLIPYLLWILFATFLNYLSLAKVM
ncbi:MAG: TspO/MBR family protein [Nanoarchaeota archaeon]